MPQPVLVLYTKQMHDDIAYIGQTEQFFQAQSDSAIGKPPQFDEVRTNSEDAGGAEDTVSALLPQTPGVGDEGVADFAERCIGRGGIEEPLLEGCTAECDVSTNSVRPVQRLRSDREAERRSLMES